MANKKDKPISLTDAVAVIAAYDKIQMIRKEEQQGIYVSDFPWPFCYRDVLPWRLFASVFSIGYINQVLALVFGLGSSNVSDGFIPIWFAFLVLWIPFLGSGSCAIICIACWFTLGPFDNSHPPEHQETEYERKYQ